MKKTNQTIVATVNAEVSCCPYCGGVPTCEVETKSEDFKNTRILRTTTSCPWCGLSAPKEVWEAVCENIQHPISAEAAAEREEWGE